MLAALLHAEQDPAGLSDAEYLALLGADGADLDALCALADDVRADVNGDDVTYVVNRNINFTNVCYTGCRFCAFAQRRTDADAYTLSHGRRSATGSTRRGRSARPRSACRAASTPTCPGTAYFDLAREVKQRAARHPPARLLSPMEIVNGAARTGLSFARLPDRGEGGRARLDPRHRGGDPRRRRPLGADQGQAADGDLDRGHHAPRTASGIPTTSTMMYGHVDTPAHWVAHLRTLAALQDETGGFTEFVPLPFVHHNAPIYLAGVARPGPTVRENRAVHAMARLLLHGRIDQHPDLLGEARRRRHQGRCCRAAPTTSAAR